MVVAGTQAPRACHTVGPFVS